MNNSGRFKGVTDDVKNAFGGGGNGIPILHVLNDEVNGKKAFVEEVKEWTFDSMQRATPVKEPRVLTPEEVRAFKSLHFYGLVIYSVKMLGNTAGWTVSRTYIQFGNTHPNYVSSNFGGVAFSVSSGVIDRYGVFLIHSDDYTEITSLNMFTLDE